MKGILMGTGFSWGCANCTLLRVKPPVAIRGERVGSLQTVDSVDISQMSKHGFYMILLYVSFDYILNMDLWSRGRERARERDRERERGRKKKQETASESSCQTKLVKHSSKPHRKSLLSLAQLCEVGPDLERDQSFYVVTTTTDLKLPLGVKQSDIL